MVGYNVDIYDFSTSDYWMCMCYFSILVQKHGLCMKYFFFNLPLMYVYIGDWQYYTVWEYGYHSLVFLSKNISVNN